ncbi:MAG: transglutaminase-like domain-containing protein [Tannerella sp.]|jgi:hypothetical protein|nr:transglutaminase-like domain-containing protein [Tannerella sp.]
MRGISLTDGWCICIVLALAVACDRRSSRLEQALAFAGGNRAELEKVLVHYSANTADSLKYRAACFLIENMPFHYSYSGKALDDFATEVKQYATVHEYVPDDHTRRLSVNSFADDFPKLAAFGHDPIMDSHVVTAGFLIDNIEQSFKVWQEQPWGTSLSFEDFCEQVLPYRVADEPLQEWRGLYYDYFRPKVDSICGNTHDLLTAGKAVYRIICDNRRWIFENSVTSRHLGAETLFHCRLGDCRLMALYAVYAFRALGIPCGVDMILQNPDKQYEQHYWNYMKDNRGGTHRFELLQMEPEESNKMNRRTGKIYRSCYGIQADALPSEYKAILPTPLNDRLITDVAHEYYEKTTLAITASRWKRRDNGLLFLGVFNNSEWIPVTCSKIENGKAVFDYMEPGIVYQAFYYIDGKQEEEGFPVIVQPDNNHLSIKPDTARRQTMEINRKYPLPDWYPKFKHRSVGGRFEVSGDSLFTRPVTIHTHVDSLSFDYHHVKIDCPGKVRHIRYCSAPDAHVNMSEIKFISDGRVLKGKITGFDNPSRFGSDRAREAVFDGDPLTYADSSSPDGAWVGLTLEEAAQITEIEYIFRNDDNNIREGDVYELFYFTDTGKVSLGKRTGVRNGVLIYENAPSGALFILHNETRGREERPFMYENGKQMWW